MFFCNWYEFHTSILIRGCGSALLGCLYYPRLLQARVNEEVFKNKLENSYFFSAFIDLCLQPQVKSQSVLCYFIIFCEITMFSGENQTAERAVHCVCSAVDTVFNRTQT